MTELKQQALDKMLEEMNQPHHQAIDTLHNLLCVCDEDEVYQGILKEGKSVKGAYEALYAYARKNQEAGSYGMDDTLALPIIKDYLAGTSTTPDVKQPSASTINYQTPKSVTNVGVEEKPKPKKAKVEMSMSIFDFIDEPAETPQASEDESDDEDIGTDE